MSASFHNSQQEITKFGNFINCQNFSPKIQNFPGIPAGNFWSGGFPGIPEREFPVALVRFLKWLKLFNPDTSLNPAVYNISTYLNNATTLPRKTITMKITNFHYSACIEIEWNMEIWHFRLSQFIWRRVQSVQCPAFSSSWGIEPRSRDIPVLAHAMSGFPIYRPRKLYPWVLKSINKLSSYT